MSAIATHPQGGKFNASCVANPVGDGVSHAATESTPALHNATTAAIQRRGAGYADIAAGLIAAVDMEMESAVFIRQYGNPALQDQQSD